MQKNKTPFIARFAETREEDIRPINFRYDDEENVTMARIKSKRVPLVELKSPIPELLSKTEAIREADDYNPTSLEVELQTKTAASKESDEGETLCLELATKTFVERESDDVSLDMVVPELYTKTKQESESDDCNLGSETTLS
jgi:hypothetical protein